MDLIEWLRDVGKKYKLAPAAVFQKRGNLKWPLSISDEADLFAKLGSGGHFLPLPKEPAALANIMEVSLCDYISAQLKDMPGIEITRGKERHYPDLEVSGKALDGKYFAIDIKVARRAKGNKRTDSRITLYTGNTYFRYPQLNWPGTFRPFQEYAQHIDVIALYTLNEAAFHRIDDLELIIHEAWRLGSKKRSSTTREYIGAVDKIDDIRAGLGEFSSKDEFYSYWRKHPFKIGKVVQQQLDRLLRAQGAASATPSSTHAARESKA